MLTNKVNHKVRGALPSDVHRIVEIEKVSFVYPNDVYQVQRMIRTRGQSMIVFEHNDYGVLGYLLYRYNSNLLTIIRVAVTPDSYRRGVGRWLVNHIKRKTEISSRPIQVDVPDTDLWAHLFFKSCGFLCIGIVGDHYRFVYQE